MGIPTVTLAQITGLSGEAIAWNTTVQLLPLILITPFIMVIIVGKSVKALKDIWPIVLASGVSFAVAELAAARFLGAELPVIIGSICSMAVTIVIARKWYRETNPEYEIQSGSQEEQKHIVFKEAVKAWVPFILIFVFLLLTSHMIPSLHDMLASVKTSVPIYTGPGAERYTFTWLATPGVMIFLDLHRCGRS